MLANPRTVRLVSTVEIPEYDLKNVDGKSSDGDSWGGERIAKLREWVARANRFLVEEGGAGSTASKEREIGSNP